MNYACRHHSHIFFYCISKLQNLWESVQNRASHRWCGWWVRYQRWGPLLYGVRCAHRATRWYGVLAGLARVLHTAVLCVRMCAYVLCMCFCMCMCVFCTCVCMWPYVCLCSISAVFFTFFGNLFGISWNDPPFHWLF